MGHPLSIFLSFVPCPHIVTLSSVPSFISRLSFFVHDLPLFKHFAFYQAPPGSCSLLCITLHCVNIIQSFLYSL